MNRQKLQKLVIKYQLLVLLVVAIFLSSWRIWEEKIFFTDELLIQDAAYGFAHGEWIINPTINGVVDLAKPPLVYYVNSLVLMLGSPTLFSLRLTTVTMGVLLVFAVYKLTRLQFSKETALLAAILTLTNGLFLIFVKTANFDLPNALFATLALYFYNIEIPKRSFIFTSVFIACGILTRSFLALVVPLVIVIDFFWQGRKQLAKYIKLAIVAFLTILPWHVVSYLSAPGEFLARYFRLAVVNHVVELFAGDVSTTPFFYLKIFILFPLGIFGLYYLVKNFSKNVLSFQLSLMFAIYFLLLTVSQTRHEWYVVPLIVPLSIFSAKHIVEINRNLAKKYITNILFKTLVMVLVLIYPIYFIIKFPDEIDSIRTAKYMVNNSSTDEVLYMWNELYFTPTRFFPRRKVEILSTDNISQKGQTHNSLFLMVSKNYLTDADFRKKEKLYDGGDYVLYLLDTWTGCESLDFCLGPS